ncbi:MAG: sensor histidine kinase [Panacagrimonas sp.]
MQRASKFKLPRLLQTTAVRLALRYGLIYAGVLGAALAALLWMEIGKQDPQAVARLGQKLGALTRAFDSGGETALIEELARQQTGAAAKDRIHLLVSSSGEKLAGTLLAWPREEPIPADGEPRRIWIEEEVIPRNVHDDDAFGTVLAWNFPDGSRVLLSHRDPKAEDLLELTEYLIEALSAAVLLALLMSVSLGHTILRRIDTIGRTATEIAAGDLAQRVPVSRRNDEFDTLAARLNAMLDRNQQLVTGLREVTDNVAHDLRSPLTRLRNRLEVTLLEPREADEYREAISHGIEDADSLIRTFNALLGIAQAEAGSARSRWERVDLAALAQDVAELFGPLAEEKGQTLEYHECAVVHIGGSRDLLAQAIGNLLDNAIKHTPAGGSIHLRVARGPATAELTVTDTGPGIPQAEHQRVLLRFVRLDHSRHLPGNGLGLSLVQAVAKLHRAELVLGDAAPGLRVHIRFPLASD